MLMLGREKSSRRATSLSSGSKLLGFFFRSSDEGLAVMEADIWTMGLPVNLAGNLGRKIILRRNGRERERRVKRLRA